MIMLIQPSVTAGGFFGRKDSNTIDSETAHYTIQDMILKYRNLTNPQDREVSIFSGKSEFVSNSCIKDALSPILDQCLKKGMNEIDLKLRSQTAAKLSICEFEVANIEYPIECRSSYNSDHVEAEQEAGYMEICIIAMERKSQWWTSYSGYYRSVGEICYQESLPFEKESILNMFFDITEHYGKILQFLEEYSSVTEIFKEDSSQSFTKLMQFMKDLNSTTIKNKKQFDDIWKILRAELLKVSEVSSNVTDLVIQQTEEFGINMMSFFKETNDAFDYELQELKEKFISDLEERDTAVMKSIEETRLGLFKLNLLNSQNRQMSLEVDEHLRSSVTNARNLSGSIIEMDDTTHELVNEINNARDIMADISDILETNPFLRILMYLTQQFQFTIEMILLFTSMTSLCFFCFYCFHNLIIFKYIGMLSVSVIGGACLVWWVMCVTSVTSVTSDTTVIL